VHQPAGQAEIAADDRKERTMSDERQQQETGRERQEPKDSNDERVPAPTSTLEDLDAGEQAEDVTGGGIFY
jgi:hypothetical protein